MSNLSRLLFIPLALLYLIGCSSPTTPAPISEPLGPIAPLGPEKPQRPTASAPELKIEVTPAPVEPSPTSGPSFQDYQVRAGDTLALIAERFNANLQEIMQLNGLTNANVLRAGQVLRIPVQVERIGPGDKIIPDSEAVYGPAFAKFDVNAVAQKYGGYLTNYQERVEGAVLTGPQIIQLVAERFSVGPRVLLTVLELQGGWVTNPAVAPAQADFPMGYLEPAKSGLYKQAFWTAAFLNEGYYGRLSGRLTTFEFKDKQRARLAPTLNAGTAGVQNLFARETTWDNWLNLVGPNGFRATYEKLFGDPFAYAVEPIVPRDLKQPALRLPWEDGHLWYFTGGPHAGWVDGSAWAAIDFTPKDQAGSCWISVDWAIAAAPGRVLQAERGRVVINLDGNSFQGIGWSLLYMHMAKEDRVDIGAMVKTGDHIGHPSCEGGAAETSHLHFARLYNGQWMSAADPQVPLVMSGWTVQGASQQYDGTMTRGSESREASDGQSPDKNAMVADRGPPD